MMTLSEYIDKYYTNNPKIKKKSILLMWSYEHIGMPRGFRGLKDRPAFFAWVEQETRQLTDEELITLYVSEKLEGRISHFLGALHWVLYTRNIPFDHPFEPADDHQNPAVVQAPNSVGANLSKESDRI